MKENMIKDTEELYHFIFKFYKNIYKQFSLKNDVIPSIVPKTLRDYYLNIGNLSTIMPSKDNNFKAPLNTQDCLIPPHKLEYEGDLLIISWENQGNWSCGIKIGEGDNPNIYSDSGELLGESQGYEDMGYPLDKFLITLTLQETVMSAKYLYNTSFDGNIEKILKAPITKLWSKGRTAFDEDTHTFYLSGDNIILMEYEGLWLASNQVFDESIFSVDMTKI